MAVATGQLILTPGGCDLVLERVFDSPVESTWAFITDPDLLEKWIGRWMGEPGPGKTVQLEMRFEQTDELQDVVIEECLPPRYLRLRMGQGAGAWRLNIEVTPGPVGAGLRLSHHLSEPSDALTVGPGWDYYLDMLAAAHAERELPSWDDYYPALVAHYRRAAADLSA